MCQKGELFIQRSLRWWLEAESNHRHEDFQSSALPTELSSQVKDNYYIKKVK